MPKRAPKPSVPDPVEPLKRSLEEVVARLGRQDAILSQLDLDLRDVRRSLGELPAIAATAREALAHAAAAQEAANLSRTHEDRLNALTLAVAEGIQHVERAEARIRATVRRARESMAEEGYVNPSLEAEAAQLFVGDGGRSGSDPVLPVPPQVVAAPEIDQLEERRPTAFPGISRAQLRRMTGN